MQSGGRATHSYGGTKAVELAWDGRMFTMDSAEFTPEVYTVL